jgi:hypothetical protein
MANQQQAALEMYREHIFAGRDCVLYTHIGYFMSWFSAIELHITFWLAVTTGVPSANSFDLLARGMDARIKLEFDKLAV